MFILLVAKNKSVDIKKDQNSIKRAVEFAKKNRKEPLFITIQDYDVLAIPGEVEKLEPVQDENGFEAIKLNITNLIDLQEAVEQIEGEEEND